MCGAGLGCDEVLELTAQVVSLQRVLPWAPCCVPMDRLVCRRVLEPGGPDEDTETPGGERLFTKRGRSPGAPSLLPAASPALLPPQGCAHMGTGLRHEQVHGGVFRAHGKRLAHPRSCRPHAICYGDPAGRSVGRCPAAAGLLGLAGTWLRAAERLSRALLCTGTRVGAVLMAGRGEWSGSSPGLQGRVPFSDCRAAGSFSLCLGSSLGRQLSVLLVASKARVMLCEFN